jgi:hypothetical protein
MKFLRLLYMLLGWIVGIPIAIMVFTALYIFMCVKTHSIKKAGRTCWVYFRNGIEMNLDFIENGLFGV